MVTMATWRDGPRYAPTTRPVGFAAPAQAIGLEPAPPGPAPAAPPGLAPAGYQPNPSDVALDSVQPVPASVRDPQSPFETLTASLTAMDALGAPRNALTPFTVANASPTPHSAWAPPPPGSVWAPPAAGAAWAPPQAPAPHQGVPANAVWQSAYPPLVILLVVAGFTGSLSLVFPLLTLIMAPIILVPRVRYRVGQVRAAAWGALAGLGTLWLVSLLVNLSMYNLDLGLNWWAMAACWILAGVDLLLQRLALRNGEPPSPQH
jgi:hypothetical protein